MNISKAASRLLQNASRDKDAATAWGWLSIRVAKTARAVVLHAGGDPACLVHVRGIELPLRMPLSHRMPMYRARHRRYDALPAELAKTIRKSRGTLQMIDVGANVGDTILSTAPHAGDRYLAIEPHPDFFPYLVANTQCLESVTCLQLACGEASGILGFDPAFGGTAAPRADRSARHQLSVLPLDQIWAEQWLRAPVNFLKIDTDGFDIVVLHGAAGLLRSQQPWVLYECDVRLTESGLERHLGMREFLGDAGYRHVIAFNNVGEQVARISVDDAKSWRRLLATQSAAGPVHYHDLLVLPPGEESASESITGE